MTNELGLQHVRDVLNKPNIIFYVTNNIVPNSVCVFEAVIEDEDITKIKVGAYQEDQKSPEVHYLSNKDVENKWGLSLQKTEKKGIYSMQVRVLQSYGERTGIDMSIKLQLMRKGIDVYRTVRDKKMFVCNIHIEGEMFPPSVTSCVIKGYCKEKRKKRGNAKQKRQRINMEEDIEVSSEMLNDIMAIYMSK